ncbi:DUF2169 domain-containing protein [Paraburkholderia sp. DHOC27]|uniref:DUF2169 family type VI secretion system accessory protein n=1 Tax=Paraburkholderia sp. DHOC27 TaxID=2303330 RepID=UPI003857B3C6
MSGREVWIVAIRARFRIAPHVEAFWDPDLPQAPVKVAPEIIGGGAQCFLLADSDLVLEKQATDVLLSGHARAPRGYMVGRLTTRMRVGPVDKRIAVFGDRVWLSGRPSEPEPFAIMPIDYSRAYGGPNLASDEHAAADWYETNPVGIGYSSRKSALTGQRIPNLEDPSTLIKSLSDHPNPAGYGAIMPHWIQRRRYGGTFDATWQKERMPLLPLDFDPRFYQQAPEDQQVPGFLRGGEPVLLEGVHPDGPLEFYLPRISLAFETEFDDLTEASHRARLHTVVFEPDFPAVTLVWHTSLECHRQVNQLLETRVWERRRLQTTARRPT